jgi:hypothetical protein
VSRRVSSTIKGGLGPDIELRRSRRLFVPASDVRPNREATRPRVLARATNRATISPNQDAVITNEPGTSRFVCLTVNHGFRHISLHLNSPHSFMSFDVAAKSAATMGPDEESADSQSRISKQARIRDNQRRSRARRQEHLQDLERRLSECHVTCREAELQLNAFKELQIENVRLRQLLEMLGVNENLIHTFVHQDPATASSNSAPSLRQLKPKIALAPGLAKHSPALKNDVTSNSHLTNLAALSPPATTSSSQPTPFFTMWSTNPDASGFDPRHETPGTSPSNFPVHEPFRTQSCLPQFQGGATCMGGLYTDESFCCMVFGNKATGPLQASPENTVLCSLARELIDQYNIDGETFEQIKTRLAAGFAPPAHPGESCRVNNQLLFEVLTEISGRPP